MANYAKKVIEIALAQVGYLEKKSNSNLDSMTGNAGSNNYTKFARDLDKLGYFYNGPKNGYAWCDVFVDWCFVQAYGVDNALALLKQPKKSYGAGCYYSAKYYKDKKQFHTSNPQPGDQIFFWNSGKTDVAHTGLVYDIDATYVYTVEGNTSSSSGVIANGGAVEKKKYKLNYSRIYGYGRPEYDIEEVVTPSVPVIDTNKTEPKPSNVIHKVKKGECLWGIAEKYLGKGSRYTEIVSLNKLKSTTLKIGQMLEIPIASSTSTKREVVKGDKVKIKSGAKAYDGTKLASFVYNRTYKVKELSGKRAVLTYSGIVVAAVHVDNLIIVD